MNRTILQLEKDFILLPITFLIVPGLLYMLLVPIGDADWIFSRGSIQRQMRFMSFEMLSMLSAGAMYSIWVAVTKYLDKGCIITISKNPFLYIAIIIGILISIASLVEMAYPDHYFKQVLGIRENTAFLVMYAFGLPVCIPAIHILILGKQNRANNSPKPTQ